MTFFCILLQLNLRYDKMALLSMTLFSMLHICFGSSIAQFDVSMFNSKEDFEQTDRPPHDLPVEQHTLLTFSTQSQNVGIADLMRFSFQRNARSDNVVAGSSKTHTKRYRKARGNSRRRNKSLRRRSCPTKSSYVFKTEAEDIFGNTVKIHPQINVGGLDINQYFYESYCVKEHCKCAGAHRKRFESFCETTHSYTYARVETGGEVGWTYIKVRSGCSCVIREKSIAKESNILELL